MDGSHAAYVAAAYLATSLAVSLTIWAIAVIDRLQRHLVGLASGAVAGLAGAFASRPTLGPGEVPDDLLLSAGLGALAGVVFSLVLGLLSRPGGAGLFVGAREAIRELLVIGLWPGVARAAAGSARRLVISLAAGVGGTVGLIVGLEEFNDIVASQITPGLVVGLCVAGLATALLLEPLKAAMQGSAEGKPDDADDDRKVWTSVLQGALAVVAGLLGWTFVQASGLMAEKGATWALTAVGNCILPLAATYYVVAVRQHAVPAWVGIRAAVAFGTLLFLPSFLLIGWSVVTAYTGFLDGVGGAGLLRALITLAAAVVLAAFDALVAFGLPAAALAAALRSRAPATFGALSVVLIFAALVVSAGVAQGLVRATSDVEGEWRFVAGIVWPALGVAAGWTLGLAAMRAWAIRPLEPGAAAEAVRSAAAPSGWHGRCGR
jgi:hypothetical protein